jgi:hypothetical protein
MNKKTVMAILLASLFVSASAYANCGNDNGNGNGCSGNGDPGTQGPQGATGAQGAAGLNGVNADSGPKRSLQGELDVRLLDTKRTSFYAFNSYGFDDSPGHDGLMDGRNSTYGFKFVVKLGSSYEERILDKQALEIKALEAEVKKLSK